jgi:hypothetical protein
MVTAASGLAAVFSLETPKTVKVRSGIADRGEQPLMREPRRRSTIWVASVLVAVLAACDGSSDGDEGVASLEDRGTRGESEAGAEPAKDVEPGAVEDAMVEFTGCLHDEGIELPADDGLTVTGPHPEMEAKHPGYEAAYEACIPIIEAVTGSFEQTLEEIARFRDFGLAVAKCMRGRGYDYPDPQFDEAGNHQSPDEAPTLEVPVEQYERDLNGCADEVSDELPASEDDE